MDSQSLPGHQFCTFLRSVPATEKKRRNIEVRKYSKILNLDSRKMFVIPKCRYTKMTLNRGLIYKDKEQISPCTRKMYAIVELTLYQGVVISRFYCIQKNMFGKSNFWSIFFLSNTHGKKCVVYPPLKISIFLSWPKLGIESRNFMKLRHLVSVRD